MVVCPFSVRNATGYAFGHRNMLSPLKGLFHPAFLACAVSLLAFVVAIFVAHESGDSKSQPRRHMQCMLDETDPLTLINLSTSFVEIEI